MKQTLLLVDDSPLTLSLLKSILASDYVIKEATDGKTAIKIAEMFVPSLIILDVVMPEMNGFDICKELRKNPVTSDIPIIFVTVLDSTIDESYGFKVGGNDFITKPFNPAILKARIKTHIMISDKNYHLSELVKEQTMELEKINNDLINSLVIVSEYKDSDTSKHASHVGEFSRIISRAFGFSEKKCDMIALASRMHDIGKVGIADSVLQKPGIYTDEEREIIKRHTIIGAKILDAYSSELLQTSKILAEQHHERWNGTGYPYQLKGEEINLFSRIIAVVDVFDALVCDRSYKRTWTFEEGFNYICENKDEQFDPAITKIFGEHKEDIYNIYLTIK